MVRCKSRVVSLLRLNNPPNIALNRRKFIILNQLCRNRRFFAVFGRAGWEA